MVSLFASVAALTALLGAVATRLGSALATRRQRLAAPVPWSRPPVTILKPLYGDEPSLEDALASFGRIAYPCFQLVVGVQDASDPALAAVERVRRRFPELALEVVVDPRIHGANRKVSNLINMLPAASHDLLVLSDSDLHVAPDYLDHLVAALEQPGCGLATTVCSGRAVGFGGPSLAARLGAMQISHSFLPGVLLSRWLGREDALGTTMALHRRTLARAGGLDSLLPHLADDHLLGLQVRALGLSIGLAATVPVTTVMERSFTELWQHELRWARTIRALEPGAFLSSLAQFPLFWASLACLASGAAGWALALFGACWLVRITCAARLDQAAPGPGQRKPGLEWRECLLWPLRDVISAALVLASFCGSRVVWRGHVMHAGPGHASLKAALA